VVALLAFVAVTASARGSVTFADGKASLDVLLLAGSRWQQIEKLGLAETQFDFYRRAVQFGLTGRVASAASLRALIDVGTFTAYDLYASLMLPSGFELRFGQFIPPLGREAWTTQGEWKLVENSIVSYDWKPYGTWDIGAMLVYDGGVLQFAGAVVNGNGRSVWGDENLWKDIAARAVLRPFADRQLLELSGRSYLGRYGEDGTTFWNAAGEVLVRSGVLEVLAEYQHADWGTAERNTIQVRASARAPGSLEPVGRFEIEFLSEDRYLYRATGGLNAHLVEDHVRLMFDYGYLKRESNNPDTRETRQTVTAQLQLAL
jgi:hypothetical protein